MRSWLLVIIVSISTRSSRCSNNNVEVCQGNDAKSCGGDPNLTASTGSKRAASKRIHDDLKENIAKIRFDDGINYVPRHKSISQLRVYGQKNRNSETPLEDLISTHIPKNYVWSWTADLSETTYTTRVMINIIPEFYLHVQPAKAALS